MKCLWWNCEEAAKRNGFCRPAHRNCYYVDLRRREVRLRLVTLLGGKCMRCGYSKSIDALQFHHRDPSQKSFTISSGLTPAFEVLKAEAEKCDLLCANCHAEVEAFPFQDRWLVVYARVADRPVQTMGARVDHAAAAGRFLERHEKKATENRRVVSERNKTFRKKAA